MHIPKIRDMWIYNLRCTIYKVKVRRAFARRAYLSFIIRWVFRGPRITIYPSSPHVFPVTMNAPPPCLRRRAENT